MIGLGVWEAPISTIFYKGKGTMTISDNNGEYDFKFELTNQRLPEIRVSDINEDGNTLTLTGECDYLKGQKIPVTLTFDGDKFVGTLKAPIIGKIKIKGTKQA